MEMRDGLASIAAVVDDQSEAGLAKPQIPGDFRSLEEQGAEQRSVLGSGLIHARNRLLGNDQNVGGGLGMNVAKRQYRVVLIDDVRRDLAGDDAFEKSHASANT